MVMFRITEAKQFQMMVLYLCALLLFSSCSSSQNSEASQAERNPCDELERSERSYRSMERQPSIDEDLMLEMQERISELQLECDKYKERAERYATEYGLSTEDAEKQAAKGVPPSHGDDVRTAGVPTWMYLGIISATVIILGLGAAGKSAKKNFMK